MTRDTLFSVPTDFIQQLLSITAQIGDAGCQGLLEAQEAAPGKSKVWASRINGGLNSRDLIFNRASMIVEEPTQVVFDVGIETRRKAFHVGDYLSERVNRFDASQVGGGALWFCVSFLNEVIVATAHVAPERIPEVRSSGRIARITGSTMQRVVCDTQLVEQTNGRVRQVALALNSGDRRRNCSGLLRESLDSQQSQLRVCRPDDDERNHSRDGGADKRLVPIEPKLQAPASLGHFQSLPTLRVSARRRGNIPDYAGESGGSGGKRRSYEQVASGQFHGATLPLRRLPHKLLAQRLHSFARSA